MKSDTKKPTVTFDGKDIELDAREDEDDTADVTFESVLGDKPLAKDSKLDCKEIKFFVCHLEVVSTDVSEKNGTGCFLIHVLTTEMTTKYEHAACEKCISTFIESGK